MKVYNDLLLTVDEGNVSTLSAWSDRCLRQRRPWPPDVSNRTSVWSMGCRPAMVHSSYLSDRSFQVVFKGSTSCVVIIFCCASGFCSRPWLFILYTADLSDVVAAHDINIHSYADDTQLYLRCRWQHRFMAAQWLQLCIADVSHWMAANRLKLNPDKTELPWAGSKYGRALLGSRGPPLQLGEETITTSAFLWRYKPVRRTGKSDDWLTIFLLAQ